MSYYNVKEWMPGVYRITSPECVFMELIVGEEKALLFDTGWGCGNLLETVKEITDKPLILINSHGHMDHVNGNYQFDEPIYIHSKDVELCRVHGGSAMRAYMLTMAEQSGGLFPEDFDKESFRTGEIGELLPLEEGFTFYLGGKSLKVVELPGHTAGSIGLLYLEEKVFFVGDAINGCLLLNGPEATSLSIYISTLEKAERLDFLKLVQSHQVHIFDKDILALYLKTARGADWEKGIAHKPEDPNSDVKICFVEGKTMADIQNLDCACIVLSKEKMG